MAPPLLLTPEVADRIVNLVKLGNYQETAAAAAGIDARTMRRWLKRGAGGDEEPYATFAARVIEAEASAESRHVGTLYAASRDDWRASAWILAHKSPDRWGDKIRVEVTDELNRFIDVAQRICRPEDFEKLLEALAEGPSAGEAGEAAADGSAPVH